MEILKNERVLVTGASGLVASHVVKLLLQIGAKVRGTVRNVKNEQKVGFLKKLPNAEQKLELIEADLLEKECWKRAVKDCKYVIHVASPFPLAPPENPDDLIKPAVHGTLSVLEACAEERGIRRVVVTSSIVAVHDAGSPMPTNLEEAKTFTEKNWTNGNDERIDSYARSKALAEQAAWEFVKNLPENKRFEMATINPGLVLGPILNAADATSTGLIKRLLDREVPALAKLFVAICDVRDVAKCHLKALIVPEANGNRHIVVSKSLWMKQVAIVLSKEFRQYGYSVPTFCAPNFFVWLNSLIDSQFNSILPRLSLEFFYSNKRMINVLKVNPTDINKTINDTGYSLIEVGVVKPKNKKITIPSHDFITSEVDINC